MAAKIEVSFAADIAPLRRPRPELLEMEELGDQPACPLAEALLYFLLRRFPWRNQAYRPIGVVARSEYRAV